MNGPYRTSQTSSVPEENNPWEPTSIEVKSFTRGTTNLQITKKEMRRRRPKNHNPNIVTRDFDSKTEYDFYVKMDHYRFGDPETGEEKTFRLEEDELKLILGHLGDFDSLKDVFRKKS